VKKFGGSGGGVNSVNKALMWLARVQNADGSWGNQSPAHTGMALLTFLAHGETPLSEQYGNTVQKAMKWLVDKEMSTPDAKTLVITLNNPVPGFLEQLSSPRAPAVIIPAEEAGKEANKIEFIGTGPFQFVEFRPDSHVKLRRFDGYMQNPNATGRDGFGGKKTAWVDTITIRFVPEGGARTAGLQSGEIQVLEQIPTPSAKRLANDKSVTMHEMMPWAFQTFIFNASQPPTNNTKVRQAIQAAIDPEEVMAISTDGSYRLLHGWQYPNTPYFQGDLGKEAYNQKNQAKAKQLLQEAGYKGEELLILTDSSFKNHNAGPNR
jgi:peptide/nickel transport system substrate-binding protein